VFKRRPISTSDINSIPLDSLHDEQPVKRQPPEGKFGAHRGKRQLRLAERNQQSASFSESAESRMKRDDRTQLATLVSLF